MINRNRPKLTITVSQEILDLLLDMREATGTNVSGMINGMLEESAPVLRQMIDAHRKAKAKDPETLGAIMSSVRKASQNAQKQAQEFEKTLKTAETQGKCSECGRTGLMTPYSDRCDPCYTLWVNKQHGNK